MDATGNPDQPPAKSRPAVCDFSAGVHLYGAVMTALYDRERTGQGRVAEVAMQDATYATLASNLGMQNRFARLLKHSLVHLNLLVRPVARTSMVKTSL